VIHSESEQTREKIVRRMKEDLGAVHVELIDESWRHAGHAGAMSGGGHFILLVVSEKFAGVNLLDRNRMVYGTLQKEIGKEIHALAIRAKTPGEWRGRE
jgi:BolA protein